MLNLKSKPMKSVFLSIFLVLIVVCANAEKGVGSPEIVEISDNTFAIMDLFHSENYTVNAGAIVTENSIVFIDAGITIHSAKYMWEAMQEEVGKKKNIYLILTHYHSDHSFGMNFFKEKGAIIIEHQRTKEFLDKYKHDYKEFIINTFEMSTEEGNDFLGDVQFPDPDITITTDTILTIDGEEIHLLDTPGHVPGGISVYYPKGKSLFASDQMYEGTDLTTHFGEIEDWQQWIEELEAYKELDIETICPGHGKLCGFDEVDRNITYLQGFIKGFKYKQYLDKKKGN